MWIPNQGPGVKNTEYVIHKNVFNTELRKYKVLNKCQLLLDGLEANKTTNGNISLNYNLS